MNNYLKYVSTILCCGCILTNSVPALAAATNSCDNTPYAEISDTCDEYSYDDGNVVFIREDVSSEVAMQDDLYIEENDAPIESTESNEVVTDSHNYHWSVTGKRLWEKTGARPYGTSSYMDGSTVISLHHYTRVYFGARKFGDSYRCWGYNTVSATGTLCISDIANGHTLYVKYGITDD